MKDLVKTDKKGYDKINWGLFLTLKRVEYTLPDHRKVTTLDKSTISGEEKREIREYDVKFEASLLVSKGSKMEFFAEIGIDEEPSCDPKIDLETSGDGTLMANTRYSYIEDQGCGRKVEQDVDEDEKVNERAFNMLFGSLLVSQCEGARDLLGYLRSAYPDESRKAAELASKKITKARQTLQAETCAALAEADEWEVLLSGARI